MAQYYSRGSWAKFRGKTEWKGGRPGTGLIHTVCGGEIKEFVQTRTVWEDDGPGPCAGTGEMVQVGTLACVECDGEPKLISYGHPIMRSEYFNPAVETVAHA